MALSVLQLQGSHLKQFLQGTGQQGFHLLRFQGAYLGVQHAPWAFLFQLWKQQKIPIVPIVLLLVTSSSLPPLFLLLPPLHSTFFTFLGIVFHLPTLSGACPTEINAA